ncbi:MAG: Gfo/Idh/MocA family oxidoreductase [Actinomycetota bacterium]|nr:Gfo/Idh/MocA family oxidoreductase [Actinomycetota bacterium]
MIRVALLSFWHVHAHDYAREAKEHPEAEIVAVWDEIPDRGRSEATKMGVDFHENLEDVLAREDVDGVVVTTPTASHRGVIPAATRAGKHVFTEKVIAPTLREAEEIASEAERAGVAFVVSLPRLYAGYTRALRETLGGGALGEITYLRVRVSHDGALPGEGSPGGWLPGRFFAPEESAGGVTVDFGAHPLYLLAHLLGMPEDVRSAYGYFTGRVVEDNSVIALRYPNGAIGVAEASFVGSSVPFLVEAHGTEGSLLYNPDSGLRVRRAGTTGWEHQETPPDGPSPFRRWVGLASRGEADGENVRAALNLSALAEAANLSAAENRPVRPDALRRRG